MNSDQQLDQLLKQSAAAHQPALPSPDLIWWRAHILRKQEQKQRIERPIRIVGHLALVVCVVLCLAWVITNIQSLKSAAGGNAWLLLPLGIAALVACAVSATLLRTPAKD